MPRWMLMSFRPGTDVVLAQRQSHAGSDQAQGFSLKMLLPVFLGIKQGTIIAPLAFIDEDITLVNQPRPDIPDTSIQTCFQIDVYKSEEDRRLEQRQGICEPSFDELA